MSVQFVHAEQNSFLELYLQGDASRAEPVSCGEVQKDRGLGRGPQRQQRSKRRRPMNLGLCSGLERDPEFFSSHMYLLCAKL